MRNANCFFCLVKKLVLGKYLVNLSVVHHHTDEFQHTPDYTMAVSFKGRSYWV